MLDTIAAMMSETQGEGRGGLQKQLPCLTTRMVARFARFCVGNEVEFYDVVIIGGGYDLIIVDYEKEDDCRYWIIDS